MEKKYKKLIKNTSIFAIGTFGSKILIFLIVPVYTYVLSTSEYGTIDLITSSINLLIPFTTLLIYEAAIRFLVGKECNEKIAFNNSLIIFVVGSIFSILLSLIVLHGLNLMSYYNLFVVLLILNSYTTIFGQYLRAKNDNWGFSISGIINTFFTVFFNLFFLIIVKKGILGYIYSLIISQFLSGIYILFRCDSFKQLDFKSIDYGILKKMLIYSLPLVPNNIMWWIMNAGDKYVINYFLGPELNGIFSISYKVPTLITVVFSIFMQAWQVSAIEESNEKSRNEFYKNIFNTILFLLVCCTALIIISVKPVFENIIGSDYVVSWKYVPILSLGTLFNCLSTFAGIVYIVKKDSKGSFLTTVVGAISNLLINFLLIKKMGLLGVAIGTSVGYIVVMLLRFRDFKNYFKIELIDLKTVMILLLIIFDALLYTFVNNNFRFICAMSCILLIIGISKKEIVTFLSMLKAKCIKCKRKLKPKD